MSNLPLLRQAAEAGWTPLHTALMDAAHKASAQGFTTGTTNWACSMVASLRSALEQQEDGWRPIETAPKEQMLLLAGVMDHDADWRIKVGYWNDDNKTWRIFGASWTPLRWMPLPPPPSEGNDK